MLIKFTQFIKKNPSTFEISLIISLALALSISNHFLNFWNRNVFVQALIFSPLAILFFLGVSGIGFQLIWKKWQHKYSTKEKILLSVISLFISSCFIFLSPINIPLHSYPKPPVVIETLSITNNGEHNMFSKGSFVGLIEVNLEEQRIPLHWLIPTGTWERKEWEGLPVLLSEGKVTSTLKYDFETRNGGESFELLFAESEKAGIFTIELGNKTQTVDLFKYNNGTRRLELVTPRPSMGFSRTLVTVFLYGADILVLSLPVFTFLALFWIFYRRTSKEFRLKNIFVICCVVVIIAFLLPRLPWFVDYPIPMAQNDTDSYIYIAQQILHGKLPDFSMRTPGYPLFITAIYLISPHVLNVVILQNLLTLLSVLFFLWVVYRKFGWMVIGAAIAMIAHVIQPLLSAHDFMILTESLFTSVFLFCLGFFLLAIHSKNPLFFFLFSTLGGFAIWVRPSGAFLLGSLLIVFLYLIFNRFPIKSILCLALPMPAMLLLLMLYNYFTLGVFSISRISALTYYGMTSTFWEPDDSFPDAVNIGIYNFYKKIPETDQWALQNSWEPSSLTLAFTSTAGEAIYSFPESVFNTDLGLTVDETMALAGQVAWKAIKTHPDMALKFFWANLYSFMVDNFSWHNTLYEDMDFILTQMEQRRLTLRSYIALDYPELATLKNIRVEGSGENQRVEVDRSKLSDMYLNTVVILEGVFDNKGWLIAYLGILSFSLFITIKSNFHHKNAFIILVISSCILGAGIVMAMTTAISNRYPCPTRFIEVLSVALSPLLLQGHDAKENNPQQENDITKDANILN